MPEKKNRTEINVNGAKDTTITKKEENITKKAK